MTPQMYFSSTVVYAFSREPTRDFFARSRDKKIPGCRSIRGLVSEFVASMG